MHGIVFSKAKLLVPVNWSWYAL